MRFFYLIIVASMSISCTTLFKSQDYRIIKASGKSSPSFANKGSSAWLDVSYEEDDPINEILAMGRWHAASRNIKGRLASRPGNEKLLTLLASALFMEKKYNSARFYAHKVLRLNNKNASAQNVLGLCVLYNARSDNDFRKAVSIFRNAFYSSSTEVASGLNLGFLYLRAKSSFYAQETFKEVIERCDDCQSAYLGMGIAHYQRNKFDAAIDAFEDGLDIDYSDEITFHLALVYRYGKKNLNKARAKFSRVLHNLSAARHLRNKARAEMVSIDEKQMYRYQQKYKNKTGDDFTDTYIMQGADKDFDLQEKSK